MEELNRMTKEQLEDELQLTRKKAMKNGILAGCAAVAAFLTIITEILIIVVGFLVIAVVFGIRTSLAARRANEIRKRLRNMAAADQVDAEFQSMRTKVLILRILTWGFVAAGFLSLAITENVLIMLGFWIIALAFGIPTGRTIRKRNEVQADLGGHVIRSLLRDVLGDDVEYAPSGGFEPDKRAAPFSFPIPKGKVWELSGSHAVKGAYHGVNLEVGNIYINEKNSGHEWDEASYGTLVFHGPWLTCDFGRKPECVVSVSTRANNFSKEKRAVVIDDKQFSKRFCVNAEDPREAYKILTPRMMEAISAVADRSGRQVYLSFMPDGKTHIGIDTQRTFFDARKSHDEAELRQKFSKEVRLLADIIDTLNVREENAVPNGDHS